MHDTDLSHRAPAAGAVACWACGGPATPDPRYPRGGLRRCAACGFRQLPVASPDHVRALYTEGYFAAYDAQGAYDEDPAQREHEARLRGALLARHAAPGRLLEVGCATGWFLAEAARRGFAAEGIEPSAHEAADARARTGLPVLTGTIEDADLDPGAFAAACGWHVLEHVVEPVAALERVRAALRPGGVLLLEVPNADSPAAARAGDDWPKLDLPHHVGHFGPRSLTAALARAGFAGIAVHTVAPAAYLPRRAATAPLALAARVRDRAVARASLRRPHPWRHELLRAVARAPA